MFHVEQDRKLEFGTVSGHVIDQEGFDSTQGSSKNRFCGCWITLADVYGFSMLLNLEFKFLKSSRSRIRQSEIEFIV